MTTTFEKPIVHWEKQIHNLIRVIQCGDAIMEVFHCRSTDKTAENYLWGALMGIMLSELELPLWSKRKKYTSQREKHKDIEARHLL